MRLIPLVALLLLAAPATAQTNPVPTALDAYALYQNDISILSDAQIDSAEALGAALERMARHDPAAVSRGWIAYNATVAAQSPAFVRGVQSRITAAGRAAVIRQLVRDMSYARRRPPGDTEATQLILAAIEADTMRMDLAAGRVEAIGRELDMGGWTAIEDRSARHTRLTALRVSEILPDSMQARLHLGAAAASPLTDPNAFGGRNFWNTLVGRTAQMPAPRAARERYRGSADRMRTLAGLIIANATYTETARVAETLTDRNTEYCLSLQQLQLRQCAASANASNEDALCLARHGFSGPSACFAALLSL
jgi:hypothetical protein